MARTKTHPKHPRIALKLSPFKDDTRSDSEDMGPESPPDCSGVDPATTFVVVLKDSHFCFPSGSKYLVSTITHTHVLQCSMSWVICVARVLVTASYFKCTMLLVLALKETYYVCLNVCIR